MVFYVSELIEFKSKLVAIQERKKQKLLKVITRMLSV
jgi:hypothetical protein